MTTNDGGPAFPNEGFQEPENLPQNGMSLRDYFAAKVIGGMQALKDERVWRSDSGQTVGEWRAAICADDAKFAYLQADAMLSAREATP